MRAYWSWGVIPLVMVLTGSSVAAPATSFQAQCEAGERAAVKDFTHVDCPCFGNRLGTDALRQGASSFWAYLTRSGSTRARSGDVDDELSSYLNHLLLLADDKEAVEATVRQGYDFSRVIQASNLATAAFVACEKASP